MSTSIPYDSNMKDLDVKPQIDSLKKTPLISDIKDTAPIVPGSEFRLPSSDVSSSLTSPAIIDPLLPRVATPPTTSTTVGAIKRPNIGRKSKHDNKQSFDIWIQAHCLRHQYEASKEIPARFIFYKQLTEFHYRDQTVHQGPPPKIPLIHGQEIDLFRLSQLVDEHGGARLISEKRDWKKISSVSYNQS